MFKKLIKSLFECLLGEDMFHKLFHCPTFWRWKAWYHCPSCGKGLRCYFDGNDVAGDGTNYCDACADALDSYYNG